MTKQPRTNTRRQGRRRGFRVRVEIDAAHPGLLAAVSHVGGCDSSTTRGSTGRMVSRARRDKARKRMKRAGSADSYSDES